MSVIRDENGKNVSASNPFHVTGPFATGISNTGKMNTAFPITTAGVPLRVGTSIAVNRITLLISNDSSTTIYISPSPTFATGTVFALFSGQLLQANMDPDHPREVYARTNYYDTTVTLIEVTS